MPISISDILLSTSARPKQHDLSSTSCAEQGPSISILQQFKLPSRSQKWPFSNRQIFLLSYQDTIFSKEHMYNTMFLFSAPKYGNCNEDENGRSLSHTVIDRVTPSPRLSSLSSTSLTTANLLPSQQVYSYFSNCGAGELRLKSGAEPSQSSYALVITTLSR